MKVLLQIFDLGQFVRVTFISSLAFSVTHQGPPPHRPFKPPDRNWAKALKKRHSVLQARRFKPLNWDRHEKNTHKKITHWSEVIEEVSYNPSVLPKNIYDIDEAGVMLSMPGSVKFVVNKTIYETIEARESNEQR